MIICPAEFDRYVLARDIAAWASPCRKASLRMPRFGLDEPRPRNPITGIAGCCARAASGQAAAAPPSSAMNSRLFHSITSSAMAMSEGEHGEGRACGWSGGIDDQLELARLHHRQVGWPRALEDATDIDTSVTVRLRPTRGVAHQSADFGVAAPSAQSPGWHAGSQGEPTGRSGSRRRDRC